MSAYKELLLGCGSRRNKFFVPGMPVEWYQLTTMDYNKQHKPDIVWNLEQIPLPFGDNVFDEIHAYEVLEHTGRQGDYRFFFAQFEDFWRILKPDGLFVATCPMWNSPWAWGDPSHTRVIQKESLTFLDQEQYDIQVGKTAMSDFRHIYHGNFKGVYFSEEDGCFTFVLQAKK